MIKKEKARAGVLDSPGKFSVREFPVPRAGEKDVLLEVEMCTICGSDLPVYLGHRPNENFPVLLGHELVGRVAELGPRAAEAYGLKVGDRVVMGGSDGCGSCRLCREGNSRLCLARKMSSAPSCLEPPHLTGGLAEYMYIRGGRNLHKIDEGVPAEAGCLGNNVGNGVYYTQIRGGVQKGNSVVVSGVGGQGLGSVIGAKDAGAYPIIAAGLALDRRRLDFAQKLGADYAIDVQKEDAVEKVKAYTGGEMADVVVETSGHPQALKLAMHLARPTGTVVLVGLNWSNLPTDSTFVNETVHRALNVLGALGPRKPAMDRAARIINSRQYPIEEFITHQFTLDQLADAFHTFAEKKDECIKVGINPWK